MVAKNGDRAFPELDDISQRRERLWAAVDQIAGEPERSVVAGRQSL